MLLAFPSATMVAQTRLNITLYVHCCLVVNHSNKYEGIQTYSSIATADTME
jgi:hypothetical protein